MTATTTRASEPRANERPSRPPRVISFSQRLSRWDLKLSPYLYISPFFIMFAIVGLFPIAFTAVISFQDWDLVRNSGEFIGFDQYLWILGQPQFWTALRNTFSIFLLSSVPQLIVAIFIAAMLDRNIRAKTFWRMSVLVPFVMAPVAVALIFSNMFGDNHGLVNNVLTNIGLDPVPWHKDPFWSHIAIATMVNFRWTGYNTLIMLAAMQAIPRDYLAQLNDLYEDFIQSFDLSPKLVLPADDLDFVNSYHDFDYILDMIDTMRRDPNQLVLPGF